jgi:hypothetical protein
MRKITFFSALTVMLISLSCNKDELPDSGGTILDKVIYNNNSGMHSITKYSYNVQDKLAGVTISSPGSSTVHSENFEYDAQGRVTKYFIGNTEAGIVFHYTFIYDVNNKIIRSIGTPTLANLTLDDYSFAYDAQNRIVGDSTYNGSVLKSYRVFIYDDKDNIISTEEFEKSGSFFSSGGKRSMSYDHQPNPHRFNGNILYFGGLLFSNLSQNNIVSQTPAYGFTVLVSDYYKNGLLRKQTSSSPAAYQVEYFYK